MGVNWVDLILVAIVVLLIGIEMKRGFGRAFFDVIAIIAALYLVSFIHGRTSSSFAFLSDEATNGAFVYATMLAVCGAACWFLGKLAYDSTLLSLEPFEPFLGGVLGVALAVIMGHAFTKTLALIGTVNGKLPAVLTHSALGMEFYDFKTYHSVLTMLASLAK